jgi:predicted CXXCH cytochrome family protein
MISRIQRLLIAVVFALLAAGATLAIARAQTGGPIVPNQPTPQTPACVACHTEFGQAWQNGPHGHAVSDPKFVADWTSQGKPGACLVCHVTNYDPATGTWLEDGVACEACHGPMVADHPKEPMPVDRSPELCARCHSDTRFDWQNWQGSTHYQRGMSCITCHDPHSASLKVVTPRDGTAQYNDASELCITCHKDVSMNFPYSVHQKQGVTCINCHVTHTQTGSTDVHAVPDHSFKANLDSCNTCHSDQMHNAAAATGAVPASALAASVPAQIQAAGLTTAPSPVSPIGYAALAALIGLAAGMIMAPWLEKWYRRALKHDRGDQDE